MWWDRRVSRGDDFSLEGVESETISDLLIYERVELEVHARHTFDERVSAVSRRP